MGKDLHKSANTQISNPTAASAARSNAQSLRSARSLKWGVARNRARSVRDENLTPGLETHAPARVSGVYKRVARAALGLVARLGETSTPRAVWMPRNVHGATLRRRGRERWTSKE